MPAFQALLIFSDPDNPTNCEKAILAALSSMKFGVQRVSTNVTIDVIVDQSLIVISPSVQNQQIVAARFRPVAKPVLCFTKGAYMSLGMTTDVGSDLINLDAFELDENRIARKVGRLRKAIERRQVRKVNLTEGPRVTVCHVAGPVDDSIVGMVPQGTLPEELGDRFVLFARRAGTPTPDGNDRTFPANRVGFPLAATASAEALSNRDLGVQFMRAVRWATGHADTSAYRVLLVVSDVRQLTNCEVAIDRAVAAKAQDGAKIPYEIEKKSVGVATCLDTRAKSLVILSPSADQTRMGDEFRSVAVPVICFSRDAYLAMGMAVAERFQSGEDECNSFEIAQHETHTFSHPLMADFIGSVPIDRVNLSWVRRLPDNSTGIGSFPQATDTDTRRFVLFGCRAATQMLGTSEQFPARRAAFPLVDGMSNNCLANNPDNKLGVLFASVLKWAVGEVNTRQFDEVFKEEWHEIYKRRLSQSESHDPSETRFDGKHAPADLVGIALSGGGIRSATFCLGVLQALNEMKLLGLFDYLSTVSGGGYVGGWWSAYLSRLQARNDSQIFPRPEGIEPNRLDRYRWRGSVPPSEGAMDAGRDPIHHLRLFANYLTPRKGILSGDTWRAVAVVTRNLLLTWVMLLPILFSAVVAAQSVFMLRENARESYLRDYRADVEAVQKKKSDLTTIAKSEADDLKRYIAKDDHDLAMIDSRRDIRLREIERDTEYELASLRTGYHNRLFERARFIAVWWLAPFAVLILFMLAAFMRSNSAIPYLVIAWDKFNRHKIEWGFNQSALAHLLGLFFVVITILIFSALVWPGFFDNSWSTILQFIPTIPNRLSSITRHLSKIPSLLPPLPSLLLSLPRYLFSILSYLTAPRVLGPVLFCAIVGAIVLYTMPWRRIPGPSSKTGEELRRGVWRNRITKVHSTLLVIMMAGAVVLGFAGFGHDLFDFIFRDAQPRDWVLGYVTKAGGWITVIGAIVGAAFTAFKSAPTGGKDSGDIKEPPVWHKAVFALTPPLVMVTLMVVFAWLANHAASSLGLRKSYPWPLTGLIISGILLAAFFAQMELDWWRRIRAANKMQRWTVVSLFVMVIAMEAISLYLIFSAEQIDVHYLLRFSLVIGVLVGMRYLFEGSRFADGLKRFEVKPLPMNTSLKNLVELQKLREKRKVLLAIYFNVTVIVLALGWLVSSYPGNLVVTRWQMTLKAALGIAICPLLLFLEVMLSNGENKRARALILAVFVVSFLLMIVSFRPDLVDTRARFAFVSLGLLVGSLTWVLALGWMADPNAISMHGFYRARLIRAYLGASNQERKKDNAQITDTAIGDDVLLRDMRNCERGGPYHLLNATLNLTAGRDLTTAQRSSAMFVLSRLYCGSFRTGFQRSSGYADGSLTLGMAVATSGAAVSPGMGSGKTTSSQAMLMTLMNIRLGFWAPTPSGDAWRLAQPRLWPYYSLREFLSQTNDLSSYCYLTDGGHFDNLGLYSLVERGCRFIVLVDAVADPVPCFSDLGNAIRRCRIDFNVEIDIDITPFQRSKEDPFAAQHFVVGEIVYTEEHTKTLGWGDRSKAARTGVIVYVKSSLIKDEKDLEADVRQYGIENAGFPQQSTVDQWFDESQFESYRQLGKHSIQAAFGRASVDLVSPAQTARRLAELQYVLIESDPAPVPPDGFRPSTAAVSRLFELVKSSGCNSKSTAALDPR